MIQLDFAKYNKVVEKGGLISISLMAAYIGYYLREKIGSGKHLAL